MGGPAYQRQERYGPCTAYANAISDELASRTVRTLNLVVAGNLAAEEVKAKGYCMTRNDMGDAFARDAVIKYIDQNPGLSMYEASLYGIRLAYGCSKSGPVP